MGSAGGLRKLGVGGIGQDAANPWWDPDGEGLCVWSSYEPEGAADFAASLIDLTGNGNNAIDPGGADTPTWDAVNGWNGDGVSDYIGTTFTPDNDQSQTVIIQYTGHIVNKQYVCGSVTVYGVSEFSIGPSWDGGFRAYNGNQCSGGLKVEAGIVAVAGPNSYVNGVFRAGPAAGWAHPSTSTFSILCRQVGGGQTLWCVASVQRIVLYHCNIGAVAVAAVTAAMAAL